MSISRVKQEIIESHKKNNMLSAPFLSNVQQGLKDLSTEQPNTQLHPNVIKTTTEELTNGQTHYVDVPGIAPLREVLIKYFEGLGIEGYEKQTIAVTASVQESRFLSLQIISESFSSVGVPEVVHPNVRKVIGLRPKEVHSIPVDMGAGMLPTLEGIRDVLANGCRLVYLESPVRLTGATFDARAIEEIAAMLTEFDGFAIWDQGLCPWILDEKYVSLGTQPNITERATLIGETFPGVGLEGWGVGYLATSNAWFPKISKLKQVMSICTSTPSQLATLKASENYEIECQKLRMQLSSARQIAVEVAKKVNVEVITGKVASLLTLKLANATTMKSKLSNEGYLCADGKAFGAPETLRLAVTPDGLLSDAISLLSQDRT